MADFFVTVFSSLKVGVLTCLGTDLFDKLNSTRKEKEIYLTYFSYFGFGLKFYGMGFFQSDSRRYSLHSPLKDYRSQRYLRQNVGSNNLLHIVFNIGYFETIPRCYSRIGRDPNDKEQVISIGFGCERLGTVVHETMHALGFFHEHTRPDRDKYITLDWSNIEQGKWNTVFFLSWKILIIVDNVYKLFRLSFVSRLSL